MASWTQERSKIMIKVDTKSIQKKNPQKYLLFAITFKQTSQRKNNKITRFMQSKTVSPGTLSTKIILKSSENKHQTENMLTITINPVFAMIFAAICRGFV